MKLKTYNLKHRDGFTLIEFIIYFGIVTVILVVALNFSWEIIYGNIKSQAQREVQQNLRFCMEKIIRTIEEASTTTSPVPGNSSSTLSLRMSDPSLTPTVFWTADNKLYTRQGLGSPYELTNNRIIVSNLQFTNLSYPDTPGTIKVDMTAAHVNPDGRSEYRVSFTAESTASLVAGGAVPPYITQLRYRWRNDNGEE